MNSIRQMYVLTVNICCLLLVITSCSASPEQANSTLVNKINVENATTAVNDTKDNKIPQTIPPAKVSVPIEGGSVVSDQHDQTHSSREGKVDAPSPVKVDATSPVKVDAPSPVKVDAPSPVKVDAPSPVKVDAPSPVKVDAPSPVGEVSPPKTNNSTSSQTTSSTVVNVAAINKPPTVLPPESTNSTIKSNNTVVLLDTDVKPVYEVPPKVDGKNSVPKKEPKTDDEEPSPTPQPTITVTPIVKNVNDTTKQGNKTVNNSNVNQMNTTITPHTNTTVTTPSANETTTKVVMKKKAKKPLFTEATDDAPSHVVSNVPNLENLEKRKSKSADYVVPIVGIILSVPLVTIIVSVLYKRTAEWWHHRHYRRMDFLIEGMYNN